MKRVMDVIQDAVPAVASGLKPSYRETSLVAALGESVDETTASASRPAPTDYAAIARASIEAARHNGRSERIALQEQARRFSVRRGRSALALQSFREQLPPAYRGYMTAPARTAGNQEARDLVAQLHLGRSVHLYGPPGTTKTHLGVWTACCLIRRYGVTVRYLDKTVLKRLAYDHDNPPNFLDAEVIFADDLDKLEPGNFTSPMLVTLLGRPELGGTLISTAQRPLEQLAARYEPDPQNREALLSRLFYLREAQVTGPDFRPFDAARRWPDLAF